MSKKISLLENEKHSSDDNLTFVIKNEDHTLGNALKSIISRNPDVSFCGYTVPHPQSNEINLKVQTNGRAKATDVFKKGLEDLSFICDLVLEQANNKMK